MAASFSWLNNILACAEGRDSEDPRSSEFQGMKTKFEMFGCAAFRGLTRWNDAQAYTPAKSSWQEQSAKDSVLPFSQPG